MSKPLTTENLLITFPSSLAVDEGKKALASVTAQELFEMYEDNNLLAIYTRIDTLDEALLDILAFDFKVDWWDLNYSLEEKRKTFKGLWSVHRVLGTPQAVITAISAIYDGAELQEWWQYEGEPFHFSLTINTGNAFPDYSRLTTAVEKIKYYKSLRSVLDNIEFITQQDLQLYVGVATVKASDVSMTVAVNNPDDYTWLTDESGNYLTDENGRLLFDEEA